MNPKKTIQLLYLILLVSSFFLGYLFAKTQYLQEQKTANVNGNNIPAQAQAAPQVTITNDDIKSWAKEIGLNTQKFNECFDNEKYKSNIEKDLNDGKSAGVEGTPAFFVNGTLLVGAQPYQAFKDIIDKELNGEQGSDTKVDVEVGTYQPLGDKNAQIKIIGFVDFECPFCKRFWSDAFPQIKKDYVDTGKVVFYYRNFPLDFHPLAKPLATGAECANEQGKFWPFHDKVFQSQG